MKINPKAAATALAAATAVLAAGCGGSDSGAPTLTLTPSASSTGASSTSSATAPPTSGPVTSNPSTGGSQGPDRCHTSMLAAVVAMASPGAGQRYAALVLTNVSGTACLVYGFPGMLLLDSANSPITTTVTRGPIAPTLVTVPPGGHVYSVLHWTVVPAADETATPCEPVPALLEVTPPDEVATLSTPWPGGSVCQHGQIDVSPFRLGTHPS